MFPNAKIPNAKIPVSPNTARFNATIELADSALGHAAVDVSSPRQLVTLLRLAQRRATANALIQAGAPLGYFTPEEAAEAQQYGYV